MDDDRNALRMIVIEELTLTTVVGFRGSIAAERSIVLPGWPTPLHEEHITLRKSSVIVLDTGVGLIVTTLLDLDNRVTSPLHLIHEINATTTIVVRRCGHSLLFEWIYKTPE